MLAGDDRCNRKGGFKMNDLLIKLIHITPHYPSCKIPELTNILRFLKNSHYFAPYFINSIFTSYQA